MTRKSLALAVLISLAACGAAGRLMAQDSASPKATAAPQAQSQPQAQAESARPVHSYHLDFSLNELEDGKKVNSRQYSTDVSTAGSAAHIQAGTRVPFVKAEGSVDYLDVSTRISVGHVVERDGALSIDFGCDVQSLAPAQGSGPSAPVLRTLSMTGVATLTVGKAAVVSVADDPNSKRQFQLEVTATQLK